MRGDNNTAVLYMMGATLSYSLIPLWVSINHGYQNPLVFSSFWRLGALSTYLIILTTLYRPLLNPRDLLVAARLLLTQTNIFINIRTSTNKPNTRDWRRH